MLDGRGNPGLGGDAGLLGFTATYQFRWECRCRDSIPLAVSKPDSRLPGAPSCALAIDLGGHVVHLTAVHIESVWPEGSVHAVGGIAA